MNEQKKSQSKNIVKYSKYILEKLNYRIVGNEYGRLGALVKKYGGNAVIMAIDEISKWSFEIDNPLNYIEKQAQKYTEPEHDDRIEKLTKW